MRICFNQPGFIPWGGFFSRFLYSDQMVLLDDTQLSTGFTYVNRNRIKGPEGEVWISVPVKKRGRGRQKIKDLELYKKDRWAKDFLLTLWHFYVKSIYFQPVYKKIKEASDTKDESFLNLILNLLNVIKNGFGIGKDFTLQSDLGIKGKGINLLLSITKELNASEVLLPYFSKKAIDWDRLRQEKIKVTFLRFSPPQYPQFWGPFIRKLSALDLLMCMGKDGKKTINRGTYLYNFDKKNILNYKN
jgi:hypothetical protein